MELLQALQDSGFAAALRRADTLYPFLNAAHILAIGLVVGAIGPLDLRILGVFRRAALDVLAPPLSRMAAIGVVAAIGTGFIIFSVQPVAYAQNPAFLMKVGLVALGAANAMILHRRAAWRDALAVGHAPTGIKIQAVGSMVIWVMAVISGRWIAFVD